METTELRGLKTFYVQGSILEGILTHNHGHEQSKLEETGPWKGKFTIKSKISGLKVGQEWSLIHQARAARFPPQLGGINSWAESSGSSSLCKEQHAF